MPKIDFILKNSTVFFYDKIIIADECYVKFKVDTMDAFFLFNEKIFAGANVELIDVKAREVVDATVLAVSVNGATTYGTTMTGSCAIRFN